jgi:hypothetical protein
MPRSPRIVHGLSITEMDKGWTVAGPARWCTPPFPNLVRGGVHPPASPWIVHGLSITEMDKARTAIPTSTHAMARAQSILSHWRCLKPRAAMAHAAMLRSLKPRAAMAHAAMLRSLKPRAAMAHAAMLRSLKPRAAMLRHRGALHIGRALSRRVKSHFEH